MHVLSLRSLTRFSCAFVLGACLLSAAFARYYWYLPVDSNQHVLLYFDKGNSVRSIASKLTNSDVVQHSFLFELISRILLKGSYFYAGEYMFSEVVAPAEVYAKLSLGDVHYRKITFPEGWSLDQMLSHLEQQPYLQGDISQGLKEGYLLPDTYHFSFGDTRSDLLDTMLGRMEDFVKHEWPRRAKGLPLKSIDEALVLASIVEKETAIDSERKRIAAVFINRLRRGMRLQADPTVIYAHTKGSAGGLGRLLTKKDLRIDSPYNTYMNSGLPPTPIANPGVDSILAVLHPEESDYLYFVADGNGGHNFAKTLKEHNRNVKYYRDLRRK